MIPLSEKLIQHLVDDYGLPTPTKNATEKQLNRVYGYKVAALLTSGEMSPEKYVELASPEEIDKIELIKSGCLYEE